MRYQRTRRVWKASRKKNKVADNKVVDLSGKVTELEGTIGERDARIVELEEQLSRMRGEQLQFQLVALKHSCPWLTLMDFSEGVGSVQVGAFKNKNFVEVLDNNPNFWVAKPAKTQPIRKKLRLVSSCDYWEADTFKKYMREMVKDVWIVPSAMAVLEIKDVLDGGRRQAKRRRRVRVLFIS